MKSLGVLGIVSTGMTFLLMSVMIFYGVDALFFNGELQYHLLVNYRNQMLGIIMIIVFGGGGLAMYFATRSNEEFDQGMQDKIEAAFDHHDANMESDQLSEHLEVVLRNDEAFHSIHRRFKTYLLGLSSGPGEVLNIALDYHSAGRPMMMYVMIFT